MKGIIIVPSSHRIMSLYISDFVSTASFLGNVYVIMLDFFNFLPRHNNCDYLQRHSVIYKKAVWSWANIPKAL